MVGSTATIIVPCEICGSKNRVDLARVKSSVCGKCHSPLVKTKNEVIILNDNNFDNFVNNSEVPVLVDFWAEWCQPCHIVSPIVEEIAKEYNGLVLVAKLNVDENPITASKFGIRSIPTLLIFKNGSVFDQIIGAVPKNVITQRLNQALTISNTMFN